MTRSRCRLSVLLAVAVCLAACGDEDADEGGATAAGRNSSESGTGGTSGASDSGAAGKAGAKPAANSGTGAGRPSAAGKPGGAAAASGGGSGGQPGTAGKGGAGAAAGDAGSDAGDAGAAGAAGGNGACNLACAQGTHCELVAVTCIRAPCPAQPMCVASAGLSCDPRKILCKRVAPECPQLQVPSVDGSCYGPCVPVEQCPCSGPSECPDSAHYTCHMSAAHCTPYL